LDLETEASVLLQTTPKGWMNRDTFLWWLQRFDDQLERPSLLLLDSCPAHNEIDFRNIETGEQWKHLTIRRLPKNSTPVTQPLDAGAISVFKRLYLELLSEDTGLLRILTDGKNLSNGAAWSLIPEAWRHVKPRTLRSCFAKTPILPPEMREILKNTPPAQVRQETLSKNRRRKNLQKEERQYFERLIARTSEKFKWSFVHPENPYEDEQDIAYRDFLDELLDMEVAGVVGDLYQSMNDELRSSPIEPDDWASTSNVLSDLADGYEVCSAEGLQHIRQNAKVSSLFLDDPDALKDFNRSLKDMARACGKIRSVPQERPQWR
jgi:hypothetical protein